MKKINCSVFLPALFMVFNSCGNLKTVETPKQKLLNAFKDRGIDTTWNFETSETDSLMTAAFRNKTIGEQIQISGDTNIIIGYFSRENKLSRSSTTFRAEVIKRDSTLYIESKDAAGKLVDRIDYPAVSKRPAGSGTGVVVPGGFNSLEDCIKDFNCKHRGELLCQANATCRPVRGGIDCCLTNGQCFEILIIVTPTNPRCSIVVAHVPDLYLVALK